MNTLTKYAIPLSIGYYLTSSYIDQIVKLFNDAVYRFLFQEINIDVQSNPKCAYAITQEYAQYNIDTCPNVKGQDGHTEPEFSIQYGTHYIRTDIGTIILIYQEQEIKLLTFRSMISKDDFTSYFKKVYKKHCRPDSLLIFFTSENDRWAFPIYRRPHNKINGHIITNDMRQVMDDVEEFIKTETDYTDKCIPYRRGYLLHGPTGTGKSALVQLLATKYDRSIYLLTLNSKEMNDTILINLCSIVPPNSIICIDEIDKQLEFLMKDKQNKVSMGGILSAIDGPQRLSHSTIIIMTANNDYFIPNDYHDAFFRQGRIDRKFCLTELLHKG